MSKVLKADGQVATAWAAIDLGADHTDVWITHGLYFDDAAWAWFAGSSPNFLDWWNNTADFATYTGFINGLFVDQSVPAWSESAGVAQGGIPAPDVWALLETHYQSDGTIQVFVNGDMVLGDVSTAGAVRWIRAEMDTFGATPAAGAVVYISDFKVGTTRGGSELFADDFSSGDLSAWTSTSGAVSVIDNPSVLVWTNLGPQLVATVAGGVNSSIFSDPQAFPLSAASRSPFDILKDNVQAVSVRFTQEGASAETEIYAVDSDVRTYEPGVTGGQ